MTIIIEVPAKTLAAVALAMSDEPTRYYLCGIAVEPEYLAATDGHVLTVARVTTGLADGDDMILAATPAAVKALSTQKAEVARWNSADGILAITSAEGGELWTGEIKTIDGTFPEWRKVLPLRPKKISATAVTFDGTYLSRLHAAGRLLGPTRKRNVPVPLHISQGENAEGPWLIRYGERTDVISMLMPMRWEEPNAGKAFAWIGW